MEKDSGAFDQVKAESFLEEFVEKLSKRFGKNIDFVLLFGSAARGEFVLGKSDVDLVIQLKSNRGKKEFEKYAEALFWRLDRVYGLELKNVCSTGRGKSLLENIVKAVEKYARLYKPFEVFGPKDIDWNRGMITRLDLLPGAILVASQLTLLYKMKHEGKILYGRDIRKEIRPRFTLWEKLKGIWVPQSVAFAAVILSLLLPKKAVAYASKAIFFEVESVNLFLKNRLPGKEENLKGFASATEFREKAFDWLRFYTELKFGVLGEQRLKFVEQAAMVKKNGFDGGRLEALKFCLKSFWIIYNVNTGIILKSFFGQI